MIQSGQNFPLYGFMIRILCLFATLAIGAVPASAAETLRINPLKTRIAFEIDAVGWPTTKGSFREFQGSITVDLKIPQKSTVSFNVKSASVEAGSRSVTGFIKSASMLNTDQFPDIRFRSRSVEKTSESVVRVTGDLTFMGQTRSVSFVVDVDQQQYVQRKLGFSARGTILRSEFGFISGQPLISDSVRLLVSTEADVE